MQTYAGQQRRRVADTELARLNEHSAAALSVSNSATSGRGACD